MATRPICSELKCGQTATHEDIDTKAPLCPKHVAVQVSMIDGEYSAREGFAVFGRLTELLGAMTHTSASTDASRLAKTKLQHSAAQIAIWLLSKIADFKSISVPDQQTLSDNVEAAVIRIVDAAAVLGSARQTTREPQAQAGYTRATNDLWTLIYDTAQRARPARVPAFKSAKQSYDQMVRDQINMIAGTQTDGTNPAQTAQQAGEALDAAFAV